MRFPWVSSTSSLLWNCTYNQNYKQRNVFFFRAFPQAGSRSLEKCSLWLMLQKCFQNVTEKPNTCHQLLITSPNSPILSAAVDGQAVRRQATVPFACMRRHTPVCMRVWYAAGGGVVFAGAYCANIAIFLSLLLLLVHAAAVADVMLRNTAGDAIVSVAAGTMFSLVVLVQAQVLLVIMILFAMVNMDLPLSAAFVLSILLLINTYCCLLLLSFLCCCCWCCCCDAAWCCWCWAVVYVATAAILSVACTASGTTHFSQGCSRHKMMIR